MTKTNKASTNLVRSKRKGCFKIYSSEAWGKYLLPVDDPEGVRLTKFERSGIQLNPNFPTIPADLWSRYIGLCFYLCPEGEKLSSAYHDSQLEVQVCLLRDVETLSKWKIVVPKQTVSGTSVHAELNQNIDIETGERYDQFPPRGWVHAGSSHSHNTMDSFFSGTDDKSELTVPGLHIVIGNIDHKALEYTYKASVVLRKNRKIVENLEDVVNCDPIGLEFHVDVLEYIDAVVVATKEFYTTKFSSCGPGSTTRFWSKNDQPISYDIPVLFDDDGKPNTFFYGLDKTNSDLFDDVDDLRELQNRISSDEDTQNLIKEQITEGISMEEIIASMAEAQKDMEQEDEI